MAQIKVNVGQVTESASKAEARSHSAIVDRPEAKGGTDKGPMGGELFLMGLGGCFMSNLLAAVKARDFMATNLNTVLTGTLEDSPARFIAVDMMVSGEYEDKAEMEKLVTIAERGCIVANTLKDAVKLTISVS